MESTAHFGHIVTNDRPARWMIRAAGAVALVAALFVLALINADLHSRRVAPVDYIGRYFEGHSANYQADHAVGAVVVEAYASAADYGDSFNKVPVEVLSQGLATATAVGVTTGPSTGAHSVSVSESTTGIVVVAKGRDGCYWSKVDEASSSTSQAFTKASSCNASQGPDWTTARRASGPYALHLGFIKISSPRVSSGQAVPPNLAPAKNTKTATEPNAIERSFSGHQHVLKWAAFYSSAAARGFNTALL